jgi:uncharacterized protein YjbJ (UPF0337 family)
MVDENTFEGTARDLGGKVEDAVGGLTGDMGTQAQGKYDQLMGKAQKTFGSAADGVRDNVTNQPLTALLVVGAIGLALGFLARR